MAAGPPQTKARGGFVPGMGRKGGGGRGKKRKQKRGGRY